MKTDTIEVEIDTPTNSDVFFTPLSRKVRGRFDALRTAAKGAAVKRFPKPIPGQRIALDTATGDCTIIEPLRHDDYREIREKVEERKLRIPPPADVHRGGHVPTLLHWLKVLVDSGMARVIKGELPDKIDGKPRLRFHGKEQPGKDELLADAIRAQSAALERQANAFEAIVRELTKNRGK